MLKDNWANGRDNQFYKPQAQLQNFKLFRTNLWIAKRNGHGIQVDVRPNWGYTENMKIKMWRLSAYSYVGNYESV